MPSILTRRIGPFPGWVWGVIGGGGFLLFMYLRRQKAAATGGQPGLPAVSPAASAVPFVPSVTVTGIPPQNPGGPQPLGSSGVLGISGGPTGPPWPGSTGGTSNQLVVQGGQAYGGGTFLRSQPNYPFGASIAVPGGTRLTQTGPPVVGTDPNLGQNPMIPVSYLGGSYFVSSQDVVPQSGSGGFGYAGSTGLSNPVGGWTIGWTPAPVRRSVSPGGGWGAGSSVNTRQAPRRARRLFGGSGGGTAVNRTGARATRPLRRRNLSGR